MPNCSICGESTQLHVMGTPICVKCDEANTEERRVRNEPPKPPERISTPAGAQSRSVAA